MVPLAFLDAVIRLRNPPAGQPSETPMGEATAGLLASGTLPLAAGVCGRDRHAASIS
jgi:hypothetical protein